jgi:hypothetical protein
MDAPGIDDSEIMPFDGADPLKKDIFYEIDAMPAGPNEDLDYRPPAAFEGEVQAIFSDSAYTGTDPIKFHMAAFGTDRRNSQILAAFKPNVTLSASPFSCTSHLSDTGFLRVLKNDRSHFVPIRSNIFHYVLIGRTQLGNDCATTPSSGVAEIEGNDMVVALGRVTGEAQDNRPRRRTHVHELGHNLGLTHRGNDTQDTRLRSFEYASVMNYRFQMSGWTWNANDELTNFRNSGYSNGTCQFNPSRCDANHCTGSGFYSARCQAYVRTRPFWAAVAMIPVTTTCQDCDYNDWGNVDLRFQVWNASGRSGAGAGDAEVLDYEAGVTATAPDGYAEGQAEQKQFLTARGLVENVDYKSAGGFGYSALDAELAAPSPAYPSVPRSGNGPLWPVVDCVDFGGTFNTAHFGIYNDYSATISVPVGANNGLSPGNLNRGQPVSFSSGKSAGGFSVTFPVGTTLTWTLGDASATAGWSSPACIY